MQAGTKDHMRDYMAGRITAREYFERTKRDTDEMIAANRALIAQVRAERAGQERRMRFAQRRLRSALALLRRLSR